VPSRPNASGARFGLVTGVRIFLALNAVAGGGSGALISLPADQVATPSGGLAEVNRAVRADTGAVAASNRVQCMTLSA